MTNLEIARDLSPAELMPSMAPGRMADRLVADAQRTEARTKAAEQRTKAAVPEPIKDDDAPPEHKAPLTPDEIAGQIITERLVDLKRSATDWAPRTVTFSGTPLLLCGRRVLRDSVSIFGASATVTLATTQADLLNDTDRVITLTTTGSLNLETEGPVWANAASGTTVQVFEVFHDPRKIGEAVHDILAHMPISHGVVQTI